MEQRDFTAINVTVPYKETVIPYLNYVDQKAKEIGAVNTIVNRDGKLYGYNTDYEGLRALIKRENIDLKDKTVLILGSGGTSKTAYHVARSLECREALRVSRSEKDGCITYEKALNDHSDAEIIINTTPVGMFPKIDESAIDINRFPNVNAVLDVVYNPLRSKLVSNALNKGIKAIGGLYMLVAQAAF
ncbi:MAG: shikimate dehydrogenase, partial [Clostridia bacterium]|nr:shikimate dehydrogenase [Clostridia bacterium]